MQVRVIRIDCGIEMTGLNFTRLAYRIYSRCAPRPQEFPYIRHLCLPSCRFTMSLPLSESCEARFLSLAYHSFLSTNPEAPREEAWEFAYEQWHAYEGSLRMPFR